MKSASQKREELTHKTFLLMFKILLIFGIPAALAFFVGRWLDATYDIRPYGTLAVLGIAFISSWAMVISIYMKVNKAFAEIRVQEEEERAKKQASMREANKQ